MHKLLVVYNEPKDPAHFRKYYVETHLPLVSKIPGVKASRYSFEVKPLGPGKAPYFCIFEAEFENEAALPPPRKVRRLPVTWPTTRPAASPWYISQSSDGLPTGQLRIICRLARRLDERSTPRRARPSPRRSGAR